MGFGADGVCPRVAYEALAKLRHDGLIHAKMRNDIPSPDDVPDDAEIRKAYRKALAKGLLKVMSKMGISTLQSYKGAQIFEALGLHPDVVETCFSGTPSRIGGASFDAIQRDVVALHDHAWGSETRKRQTDPAGAWTGVNHEDVRSPRFDVLRCLHFVDVTRIMLWVVSFSISRPFRAGPAAAESGPVPLPERGRGPLEHAHGHGVLAGRYEI